ncbi:hypothetical protein V6V47_22425 [Micromonospora sp. CPCC 205539]|uniref:hypothetical protein n=1 Tax=Micromonospora sp. CPCC 205539 TaxID=3122408 RepID=UPI002FF0D88E
MPARRKTKKSRTPAPTKLGPDPAVGDGPLSFAAAGPDLPATLLEPALLAPTLPLGPTLPLAPTLPLGQTEPALPVVQVEPVLADGHVEPAPPVVPAAVEASAVDDVPGSGRPKAPTAGPPQGGGNRSAGGRSQRAGQPRRYAFRRS